jgi:hypothetical protein
VQDFAREPRFVRERFDDIVAQPGEYLVKGLIPRRGVGHLTGPSGSFKSFLALEWALSLGLGASVLGHRTHGCGAIYIASEDPDGLRKRVMAWRKVHPFTRALPFELVGQAPNLREARDVDDLIAELRIAAQEMAAEGHRLGLVLIDTLATSMAGGDENSGADMSGILANAAKIAGELGIFVLIVSHTGKDEGRGIRGWSGQLGNADIVIMLSREPGSEVSVGRVAKMKNDRDGEQFAFRLDSVSLGLDEDGDEITSCVVAYETVPDKDAKARKQRPLNNSALVLLAAIQHVTDRGTTHPLPASATGAQLWMKAVTRADVKARALASGFADPTDKPETIRKQFSRAYMDLAAAAKVNIEGDFVWTI